MKTCLAIHAFFIFLLVNCGVVLAAPPQFSQRSLMGRYSGSFSVSENVAAGGGSTAEIQASEIVIENFDGKGNFSGASTVIARVPSTANPQTVCNFDQAGTYTVAADGTVIMNFTLTGTSAGGCGSATGTMNGVVSNSGRRIDSIITNVQTTPTNYINSIVGAGAVFRQ